jgi:hypothetical protein
MSPRSVSVCLVAGTLAVGLGVVVLHADAPASGPQPQEQPPELAPVPRGVEVLSRGPVHEAFASPVGEPTPTDPVPRQPPKPVEELPPDQKPEGGAIWISGYWAWDLERKDFLWVSGVWRVPPPGKRWVAGYWRAAGDQYQWVSGFWTTVDRPADAAQDTTYLPTPPAPPATAPPGDPPVTDSFYVPGNYVWQDGRYVWRAGYWARVQPGYVWVPARYCWTPGGCVYVAGYWDYTVPARGVLYAPVLIDPVVVGPAFVYTPYYVVCDGVFLDCLFVGPCCCCYWFGDCYGPFWRGCGFECWGHFGCRHFDPLFAHARWEHRAEVGWERAHLEHEREALEGRHAGGARGDRIVTPAWQQAAARGTRMEALDAAARADWRQQGAALRQASVERREAEHSGVRADAGQPHVGRLSVPGHYPAAEARTTPYQSPYGHPGQPGWQGRPGQPWTGHAPPNGSHGHSSGGHDSSHR